MTVLDRTYDRRKPTLRTPTYEFFKKRIWIEVYVKKAWIEFGLGFFISRRLELINVQVGFVLIAFQWEKL